ncbi:MAG: methyltransferase domain-containing protein [Patescibacteria group bacterium]|nr:methyltransferase domain-containing protein [Patescibacteria group bacterium]
MKQRRGKSEGKTFWNKEYQRGEHLALSTRESEDLVKFTLWLKREYGGDFLNPSDSVLDLGCGNGRNLIHLAKMFGVHGVGYDISEEAIAQAREQSGNLPLTYSVHSVTEPLPLPDESQTLVLDMMVSHFLNDEERARLRSEITRVLKPGGFIFLKTFLLDEDRHAERLLRAHPGKEAGSYIHPAFGVTEYVFTEKELVAALSPFFVIHKKVRSHRHLKDGRAFKRRSISIYAQKK